MTTITDFNYRPPRLLSLSLTALLALTWIWIRVYLFKDEFFPLTYALPLLICVWSRDRAALWGMAVIFLAAQSYKTFWLLPSTAIDERSRPFLMTATTINVLVGAVVVEAILALRGRLERAAQEIQDQADELRAQGEELAQQNEELSTQSEELSQQTEELTQQGEELATQNEELRVLSDDVGELNDRLRKRERLLEALLETARLIGHKDTALRDIAEAALDLFGESAVLAAVHEAGGRETRPVVASSRAGAVALAAATPDRFADLILAQGRPGALTDSTQRPDLSLLTASGLPTPGAVLAAPIRNDGKPTGVFAVYSAGRRDWTEEDFRLIEWLADQCGRVMQALHAQHALRDADRRKTEFLATLSHELRNPLAPMRFALQLIETGQTSDGSAVKIVGRQFQQLVRLVDDLLDATRITSNKIHLRRGRIDLTAIAAQAAEASRAEIETVGHALSVDAPIDPVWVDGDVDRLVQVANNLLNNAARYTPPGGRITIGVTTRDGDAQLFVRDTGIGLLPADCERVFDMFAQVGGPGSGGLGIGLAIVRHIVELHGGRVEARSEGLGRGCTFIVTLPVHTAAGETAPDIVSAPPPRAAGRRVLVVDDNTDGAAMMAAVLELHGHTVWIAHDAETALDIANRVHVDVALLDIGLPGIDGYELARRLRDLPGTRAVKLVAVTGWGQDSDRARARAAGFDAHLVKPAEPQAILQMLAS